MKRGQTTFFDASCGVVNFESNHNCQPSTNNSESKLEAIPLCEAKFRRALRNVSSKAFIKQSGNKAVLCIRPHNLLELGASVNRHGLERCPATRKILRFLDINKEEFLKFEHHPNK